MRVGPNLNAIGWYCYNSGYVTHPVAQKQPNAWGLYDMHGNVVEWVQDWYDDDYGLDPVQPVTDPSGPSSGSERVVSRRQLLLHCQGLPFCGAPQLHTGRQQRRYRLPLVREP